MGGDAVSRRARNPLFRHRLSPRTASCFHCRWGKRIRCRCLRQADPIHRLTLRLSIDQRMCFVSLVAGTAAAVTLRIYIAAVAFGRRLRGSPVRPTTCPLVTESLDPTGCARLITAYCAAD